jgi:hypothetical protein
VNTPESRPPFSVCECELLLFAFVAETWSQERQVNGGSAERGVFGKRRTVCTQPPVPAFTARAFSQGTEVMSQALPQPRSNILAICSFACLGAQAVWVAFCYVFVAQSGPVAAGSYAPLVEFLMLFTGLLVAAIGVCFLSAAGTAFGALARRSGWGVLALILNALVFLGTGIPLLLLFTTPR